jgi:hypothetical protein
MALSKALSGFRPSRIRGNGPNSTGQGEYTIASGLAQNIFYGDLVTMNAGNIEVVTTIVDDKIFGVFAGCSYTEDAEPKWKRYWPTGTSASDIVAYVYDDSRATFTVQADASVTAGDVYATTFTVTLGTGSTFTGNSGQGLKAAGRGDDGQMTVLAAFKEAGNALGDAFPRVEVLLKQHVDNYVTVGVSAG